MLRSYGGTPMTECFFELGIVEFANGVRGALDLCMFAEGCRFEQELTITGDAAKLEATVPGDVVSSNAPTVEGRTSIWSIDQSNMMQQDQDMDPEIVFSGKGLKLKPLAE